MTRQLLCFFLCLVLVSGCAPAPSPGGSVSNGIQNTGSYAFTDDTGRELILTEPPETVAVLLSSLADLWITAGGQVDITVAESVERGFADASALLVDDGAGKSINIERLVAARPDLVLYSADLSGQLDCADTLNAAQIPAAGFVIERFEDYLRVLKIATDILNTPERYDTYGIQVQQQIDRLIDAAQAQENRPSVLFVRAGSSAKVTKAKTADNHFVCAMLDELGTTNIADAAPILLDGLSTEEILLSNPDFIFYTTMGDEQTSRAYMESLLNDPVWQSLDAVEEGRACLLPKELFQYKPNARWAEAYEFLMSRLYGDSV